MMPLTVSPQWLHDNFDDPNLVLLDASTQDNKAGKQSAFNKLFIKGSRQFDLRAFSSRKTDLPSMLTSPNVFQKECRKLGINNTSRIVVYDNLGIYTSPRVWWMFRVMGHKNIAVLDGGLPAWIQQGFDTTPLLEQTSGTGAFTASYNPRSVAEIDQVISNLSTKRALVIDARSPGRFNGTASEPRAGLRSGHIPHSVNVPFEKVLENGIYKSREALRDIFKPIITKDKPLIFSCGSGVTACIVLLACEMVYKNDKAVFDGSWTQWALTEGLSIEASIE
ncbi:sulfurtransferase [Fulvivirga kasyanovii]|uniref:Sulfurtransferase n=1 Tax=Fulvivirga kasyanovii TaxID=396812 RepID=A0ABW9RXA4_9BACT|nr:sulfurtransferase [Fulvivirga kasyanovii]MTI28889.1 sulfurtransferase [Fulvivirga kasyanovii]